MVVVHVSINIVQWGVKRVFCEVVRNVDVSRNGLQLQTTLLLSATTFPTVTVLHVALGGYCKLLEFFLVMSSSR